MPEFHEPIRVVLTYEQQQRAASHPECEIPYKMAHKHAYGNQERFERLLGFAMLAYVKCARTFKPWLNPVGEAGWGPYAAHWTEKNMINLEVQHKKRHIEKVSLDEPYGINGLMFSETALAREEVEHGVPELYGLVLTEMTDAQRKAALLVWAGGMTYSQVGAKLGITKQAVANALQQAKRRVRKKYPHLFVTGEPGTMTFGRVDSIKGRTL